MAEQLQGTTASSLDEVMAARRAAMLRFAIQQQEARHYAEALDMYRQLIEEYPGTEEESEAQERMLELASLLESERQPYRMLSVYNTLESMYAPASSERTAAARRARVKEILEDVRQQKQREAEAEARLEAHRQGVELASGREKPAHEAGKRAARRQGVRHLA